MTNFAPRYLVLNPIIRYDDRDCPHQVDTQVLVAETLGWAEVLAGHRDEQPEYPGTIIDREPQRDLANWGTSLAPSPMASRPSGDDLPF